MTDILRGVFAAILFVSLFILWQAWQKEHAPQPPPPIENAFPISPPGVVPPPSALAPAVQAKEIGLAVPVKTDLFDARIALEGADLAEARLARQKTRSGKPYPLFDSETSRFFRAQTGFLGKGLPDHHALYRSSQDSYALAPGEKSLEARFVYENENIRVEKVYTFSAGSYEVALSVRVQNLSATPLSGSAYFRLLRDTRPPLDESRLVRSFTGAAYYSSESRFKKLSFGNMEKPFELQGEDGWMGVMEHYFIAAWIPEKGKHTFFARRLQEDLFTAGVIAPLDTLGPGEEKTLKTSLYLGPKLHDALEAAAPGLEYAVDYGFLTPISGPIFWIISWLKGFLGNWGLAIIAFTVLIKLLFLPLSLASYRSMAKMKKVAPRIQVLREQYTNDTKKLHEAMMNLYREEKINPMSGCLPMIVQIPFFMALYWVLFESAEMRGVPFLWMPDLSFRDPYFILPVVMGATMLLQARLNPTPPDPMQAKMAYLMPIAFTVMFAFFPAGLVIYWTTNNIISIFQQWHVQRRSQPG